MQPLDLIEEHSDPPSPNDARILKQYQPPILILVRREQPSWRTVHKISSFDRCNKLNHIKRLGTRTPQSAQLNSATGHCRSTTLQPTTAVLLPRPGRQGISKAQQPCSPQRGRRTEFIGAACAHETIPRTVKPETSRWQPVCKGVFSVRVVRQSPYFLYMLFGKRVSLLSYQDQPRQSQCM